MAKDLEQRFAQAMKKGENQDAAQTFKDKAKKMREESAQRKASNDKISGMSDEIRSNLKKYGTPHAPQKRSTSDGYMPRKESAIERSNRQVAKRNAGKTKDQISEEAFKSGRTSGRY